MHSSTGDQYRNARLRWERSEIVDDLEPKTKHRGVWTDDCDRRDDFTKEILRLYGGRDIVPVRDRLPKHIGVLDGH